MVDNRRFVKFRSCKNITDLRIKCKVFWWEGFHIFIKNRYFLISLLQTFAISSITSFKTPVYPWEWVNIGMNIILIKSASVSLMVEQAAVLKVTKQQLDTKRFSGLKLAKVCIRDFYQINYIRKKWHGTHCNGLLLIQLSTVSIVLFESINFGIAQILLNCKF